MPTPINHLVIAQEMVKDDHLSPPARRLIESAWGAFLLGNTAPDVQTVTRQPRDETHFYHIPPTDETPPYWRMLSAHPELAHAEQLAVEQAVFLAGYLAHLLADEMWWRKLFDPVFGEHAGWGTWRERLFLYNVLRTFLDRQDQGKLDAGVGPALATVEPHGWLPFTNGDGLRLWRDILARQLEPGQEIRTAEVFAARMQLPARAIETALRSPQKMALIFSHAPPERMESHRADVVRRSVALVNQYLGGSR